eukprot:TRINITY_DN2552_c0_g1_i1.p1 TRINITY_DN2552_c0_g1~~TRINITY_DN2552_c0_g1_i1.p1  ORF type:complete len:156 (-),score=72.16 TRINITY_DN2552_c0_g1_i1:155-622(-)
MPKNFGKGGKNRRRGKGDTHDQKRELVFKEDGCEYAQAMRMLGNGRLEAYCFDGKKRLAHIRGNMKKKVWIASGDIILVSLRDFEDEKCDVIHKYNAEEARQLQKLGEIPSETKLNKDDDENNANVAFEEGGDEERKESSEEEKSDEEEEEEEDK